LHLIDEVSAHPGVAWGLLLADGLWVVFSVIVGFAENFSRAFRSAWCQACAGRPLMPRMVRGLGECRRLSTGNGYRALHESWKPAALRDDRGVACGGGFRLRLRAISRYTL
jgi:hypothetical protein